MEIDRSRYHRTTGALTRARLVLYNGVAFVAFSAPLIRFAAGDAIVLAAARMSFAAAIAWLITYAGGTAPIAQGRRVTALIVLAGVALGVHFASWTVAVRTTTVAHATVLVSMHPIVVAIGGRLIFKERLSRATIAGLVVALAGAAILAAGGSRAGRAPVAAGNALAIVGAVTIAIYLLAGRRVRQSVTPWRYSALVYTIAAATIVPFAVPTVAATGIVPFDLAIAAALAIVCTIGGHSLVSWALCDLPAFEVSATILAEPVFATATAVVLFGEVPTPLTVSGGVLVIAALAVVVLARPKELSIGGE